MKQLSLAILFGLASLNFAGHAEAQPLIGSKSMCVHDASNTSCSNALQAAVGQAVTYRFQINNNGVGNSDIPNFQITENFSPDFSPIGTQPVTCEDQNGNAVNPTITYAGPPAQPPAILTFNPLPANAVLSCSFDGVFTQPSANMVNLVHGPGGTSDHSGGELDNIVVTNAITIDGDFAITKSLLSSPSIDLTSGQPSPQTASYQIALTATQRTLVGPHFRIFDEMQLGLGSIPLNATLDPASVNCDLVQTGGTTPNICTLDANLGNPLGAFTGWTDFISFVFPAPGFWMEPGDIVTLTFDLAISLPPNAQCQRQDLQQAQNAAFLTLADGTTALNDLDTSNNSVGYGAGDAVILDILTDLTPDPECNVNTGGGTGVPAPPSPLVVTKQAANGPGIYGWGQDITYEIVIENTDPDHELTNLTFYDIAQNLAFTPNHTAQLISAQILQCTHSCTITSQQVTPAPILGYSHSAGMMDMTIDLIEPGDAVVLEITLRFSEPHCDTAPLFEDKFVRNVAAVNHTYPDPDDPSILYFGTSKGFADVQMEHVDKCNIGVKKTQLTPGPIIFGQPMVYELLFVNEGDDTEFGTLIDALRIIDNNYAQGMNVAYNFSCQDNGGVTGYLPLGSGSGTVTYVSQPNQGLRLMDHPGFVTFQSGGELRCTVEITVSRPSTSDRYCFSNINEVPHLENTAIFDQGLFYNSNLAFPTGPQGYNWDAVQTELPRCINASLNKIVLPLVVGPQGPGPEYTITLQNQSQSGSDGDIAFSAGQDDGIMLSDAFDLSNSPALPTLTLTSDPCVGVGAPCMWASQPDRVLVHALPAGDSLEFTYTAAPDPEFTPHELCNDISGTFLIGGGAFDPDRWYVQRDMQDRACVQIRNTLTLNKIFDIPANEAMRNDQADITVNVACTHPDAAITPVVQSVTLNAASNWQAQVYVHVESSCTVTEQTPPAAMLYPHCTWASPDYAPQQVITTDASQNLWPVEITNSFSCDYTDLEIIKQVNAAAGPQPGAGQSFGTPPAGTGFDIEVLCSDGVNPDIATTMTFGASGGAQSLSDIPVGMTCTATEPTLPAADPGCAWQVGFAPSGSITVTNGQAKSVNVPQSDNQITVYNAYICADDVPPLPYDLTVNKVVNPGPAAPGFTLTTPPANASFEITPDCGTGALAPLTFTSAGGSQIVPGQALGAICTATEAITSTGGPSDLCRWRTDVIGTTISATTPNVLTVENSFECPAKELEVIKTCDPIPASASYPITLDCEIEIIGNGFPVPGWFALGDWFMGYNPPGTLVQLDVTNMTLTSTPPLQLCQYNLGNLGAGYCLIETADLQAAGGSLTVNASVTFNNPNEAENARNCAILSEIVDGTPPDNIAGQKSDNTGGSIDNLFGDEEHSCVDVDLPPVGEEGKGDLSIIKELVDESGPNKVYRLTVSLSGDPITGPQLYVEDYVPSGMTVYNAGGNGWNCTPLPASGTALRCEYTPSSYPILPGSLPHITLFANDKGAEKPNCASVKLDALQTPYTDTNPANNDDCEETEETDLSIDKKLIKEEGPNQVYELALNLTGGPVTQPDLYVLDHVPGGMTVTNAGDQNWDCYTLPVFGGNTMECHYQGPYPINPGPLPSIFVEVINEGAKEPNCAELRLEKLQGGFVDSTLSNNEDCAETDPEKADISIEKTLEPLEPGYGIFTLQVDVQGQPVTAPMLFVVDDVPAGMDVSFIGQAPWDCQPTFAQGPDTVICEYQGSYPIPVGSLPPIQFEAKYEEGVENCASVILEKLEDGYDDSNLGNNSGCVTTPVSKTEASFEIAKAMDPSGDLPPAGTIFNFSVTNCSSGTPNLPSFGFHYPNSFQPQQTARETITLSGVTGSAAPTCTVTELPPSGTPLPAGCAWAPPRLTADNGATWHIGSVTVPAALPGSVPTVVGVSNKLVCKVDKPPKPGELTVNKVVTPPNMMQSLQGWNVTNPPSGQSYDITVTCTGGNNPPMTFPVSLTAGGASTLNIPAGMLCTITEATPPADENCRWRVDLPNQVGITPAGSHSATITNTYECKREIIIHELPRRFDVIKEIDPASAPVPPGVGFGFNITGCSPDVTSFSLGAAAPVPTQKQISATNGPCTVTEFSQVGSIPDGCQWAAPLYSTDNGANWSQTPTNIMGASIALVGANLPSVRVRNKLVCTPPAPSLSVEKDCEPNPVIMGAPGPVDLTCTLTITGSNLTIPHLILITDTLTGASGATPVITPSSVAHSGTQFLGCQHGAQTNQISCYVSGADLMAQGTLTTDVSLTVENAWETGDLTNCIQGSAQVFGAGGYGSNTACDDITVQKGGNKPDPKSAPALAIQKATLGACDVNRAAQSYTCSFGFEISNTGGAPYQGPLVVSDRFTDGPTVRGARLTAGDGWSCPGNDASGASCIKGAAAIDAGAADGFQMELTLAGLRNGGRFCNAASVGLGESAFARTIVVQEAMRLLGIDGGPSDGKAGPQTRRGIRALQANLGLEQTGQVDNALLAALGVPLDLSAQSDEICVDLPPMPLPPLQCDKGTARNVSDTECACRYDRMVKRSKTACACEQGLSFVAGRGCIKQERPRSCPEGQRLIDGACAIVTPRGPSCDPASTVKRGAECVCRFKGMRRLNSGACVCANGKPPLPGAGCAAAGE